MPQYLQAMESVDVSQAFLIDMAGETDVEFGLQWSGDFVAKKRSQAAALGINPPNQLALIPTKSERVISMFRSRLPGGLLPGQNLRQGVMVGKGFKPTPLTLTVVPR